MSWESCRDISRRDIRDVNLTCHDDKGRKFPQIVKRQGGFVEQIVTGKKLLSTKERVSVFSIFRTETL